MTQIQKSGEAERVRIAEIMSDEVHAPSGIYENDGVTPITNIDAIRLIEGATLRAQGREGSFDVYASPNGARSDEAKAETSRITREANKRGRRTAISSPPLPVAIMASRPPK